MESNQSDHRSVIWIVIDIYIKRNKKSIEVDVILHNDDHGYSTLFNRIMTIRETYFLFNAIAILKCMKWNFKRIMIENCINHKFTDSKKLIRIAWNYLNTWYCCYSYFHIWFTIILFIFWHQTTYLRHVYRCLNDNMYTRIMDVQFIFIRRSNLSKH